MTSEQKQFTAWIKEHRLPEPVCEHQFNPDRKFRFDYAWPGDMIALEVEGGIYGGSAANGRRYKGAHSSISGMLRDIEKYNLAACNGWRVLRVPPDQLFSQTTFNMLADVVSREIHKQESK